MDVETSTPQSGRGNKTKPRVRGSDGTNHRALGFGLAAIIFLLDQLTKWVVTYPLELQTRGEIRLLNFFDLRWVENRGVSMGFLTADSEVGRWMLVALTAAISIGVV
ncbi:MAG: signal peptidase II, partial [Actinobacteria bacterium]|nr:signal peptidase II [Actinomycetota bacterium]